MSKRWCWADVIISTRLWYRKIDVKPTSCQHQHITSYEKSAKCQKIYVGPTLLFRPDYDMEKLMSGQHRANVINVGSSEKSARVRKMILGQHYYCDLIMIATIVFITKKGYSSLFKRQLSCPHWSYIQRLELLIFDNVSLLFRLQTCKCYLT